MIQYEKKYKNRRMQIERELFDLDEKGVNTKREEC